jgi:hypothetical protein
MSTAFQSRESDFQVRPGRRWWRRIPWRGAALLAAAIFVLVYPVYTFFDETITGGIHRQGDLMVVDLKAMSSFNMSQENVTTADIPKRYRDLDGKRVMLTGEMYVPYLAQGPLKNFTLVYSINQCCFNGPPLIQHLVEATVLPGHSAEYLSGAAAVTGTLHVGVQTAEGRIVSVYRMDVEKVERD